MRTLLLASVALAFATAADAVTYTYVGSWQPGDVRGPSWEDNFPDGPPAYSGQEAAAFLFGGKASDYAISTYAPDDDYDYCYDREVCYEDFSAKGVESLGIDVPEGYIDFMTWYDIIGFSEPYMGSQDLKRFANYGPNFDICFDEECYLTNANSALVRDDTPDVTNYAYRIGGNGAVPEPMTWALMISGFGLVGATLRRRRALAA